MLRTLLICAATCALAIGCAGAPGTAKPATVAAGGTPLRSNCVGPTSGSRIPQSPCAPGETTFTQNDLERTGHQDTAAALQSLDSPVQIHH
jgi:hypothetical protein